MRWTPAATMASARRVERRRRRHRVGVVLHRIRRAGQQRVAATDEVHVAGQHAAGRRCRRPQLGGVGEVAARAPPARRHRRAASGCSPGSPARRRARSRPARRRQRRRRTTGASSVAAKASTSCWNEARLRSRASTPGAAAERQQRRRQRRGRRRSAATSVGGRRRRVAALGPCRPPIATARTGRRVGTSARATSTTTGLSADRRAGLTAASGSGGGRRGTRWPSAVTARLPLG